MASTASATRLGHVGRARATLGVLALAGLAVTAAGCATGSGATRASGAPTSAGRQTRPTAPASEPSDRAPDAPAPSTSLSAPASTVPVCAEVIQLYAGLVAGTIGLGDDAGRSEEAALARATAARRARVPGPVAHDLDVLAQAYGTAARALDEAGSDDGSQLDQAVTSVTAPAVTDAAHDLDRYVQAHCS